MLGYTVVEPQSVLATHLTEVVRRHADEILTRDATKHLVDELKKAFASAGVDTDKPIVTSCGSGVSAGVLTLALYRLGVEDTALYDGSWSEWGKADGPPIATGPA